MANRKNIFHFISQNINQYCQEQHAEDEDISYDMYKRIKSLGIVSTVPFFIEWQTGSDGFVITEKKTHALIRNYETGWEQDISDKMKITINSWLFALRKLCAMTDNKKGAQNSQSGGKKRLENATLQGKFCPK